MAVWPTVMRNALAYQESSEKAHKRSRESELSSTFGTVDTECFNAE